MKEVKTLLDINFKYLNNSLCFGLRCSVFRRKSVFCPLVFNFFSSLKNVLFLLAQLAERVRSFTAGFQVFAGNTKLLAQRSDVQLIAGAYCDQRVEYGTGL